MSLTNVSLNESFISTQITTYGFTKIELNSLNGNPTIFGNDIYFFGTKKYKITDFVKYYTGLNDTQKKQLSKNTMGGSKKSKKSSKRMRKIYVGPRGGKYIKKNGRKIYLNNLK
jgi:hypothetical protein